MKFADTIDKNSDKRRSPRGERGLKYGTGEFEVHINMSFPSRGTWIEMQITVSAGRPLASFPSRGTWIEIQSS
ncbi:protein of unknown function [Ruminococcaceae bacterium BL-6]|nr:protein of unknown function [Ruminococcaceae bacterium BL-6]